MKNATLHQLRVFVVAAKHLSFTKAAEELFLTQPTVSMQMKQLTKAVGLPLFEQIGKRLYLTQAGEILYESCQRIFSELGEFESAIANMKGLKQGQLNLSAVSTTKYFLPRIIGPFCQKYPGVELSLRFTNHERILQYLTDNQDDFYILSQLPSTVDVTAHRILENPLVAIAPANHPLAKESKIPFERLAEEPFIMREPGSGTRQALEELFHKHDLELKVRLELGSNEAIKQAILGGLGISVLSQHTLTLEKDTGLFAILDVEHLPIQRNWYAIYPAGKQPSVVARTFLDYLEADHQLSVTS
ncbi:transcriptional regulator, LysR family [Halothece sp. PCC 7418]|uniref:LysR family transcriptional regulator n=1 Tax=Halothece sp. (strain PCC 7418) TaxID=65093 RepID=UPI0002A07872|nr:LysR family transcriptional regulator [Halothece sp. PCC 7418]AFZ45591.1 transcriptional regulator, LysR family [Halothece sp. PCC 7418]